jgi:hypothetical protein
MVPPIVVVPLLLVVTESGDGATGEPVDGNGEFPP